MRGDGGQERAPQGPVLRRRPVEQRRLGAGLSRMDGPEGQGQRPPVSPGGGPRRAGLSESLETISH